MKNAELPCNGDGVCMVCEEKVAESEQLLCNGCSSPWHMKCLKTPLEDAPLGDWFCPDCSIDGSVQAAPAPAAAGAETDLVTKIRAIMADSSLSEEEKARKRQELMSGKSVAEGPEDIVDERWKCLYCWKELNRPVTTPCGHNYCLSCLDTAAYKKGLKRCPKCRVSFGDDVTLRINSALVMAIRMAKSRAGTSASTSRAAQVENDSRPDEAFLSERARKTGLANASSGKLFVNVPGDFFGPIGPEHDTRSGVGVRVGDLWNSRMECRQYGAHRPHVSGIAGQSNHGAQSIVLSGGYEDDEDHGEWMLYTGSGGKDLTGNKRTNKEHSSDQVFTSGNQSLRISCKMGYPVRVIRSEKELRSAYAPKETPDGKTCRYDGVYRVEKCWRKRSEQGFALCRYLLSRCDNEPAPWTSDTHGDRPRVVPDPEEMKDAFDVFERKGTPHWDYNEETQQWGWAKPQPPSKKKTGTRRRQKPSTLRSKLNKTEFKCGICKELLNLPISTPCGHNFCEHCIVEKFQGQDIRERGGTRRLRVQKVVKPCPKCSVNIATFMDDAKVNLDLDEAIKSMQAEIEMAEMAEKEGEEVGSEDEEEEEEDPEVMEVKDPAIEVAVDVDYADPMSSVPPLTATEEQKKEVAEERSRRGKAKVVQENPEAAMVASSPTSAGDNGAPPQAAEDVPKTKEKAKAKRGKEAVGSASRVKSKKLAQNAGQPSTEEMKEKSGCKEQAIAEASEETLEDPASAAAVDPAPEAAVGPAPEAAVDPAPEAAAEPVPEVSKASGTKKVRQAAVASGSKRKSKVKSTEVSKIVDGGEATGVASDAPEATPDSILDLTAEEVTTEEANGRRKRRKVGTSVEPKNPSAAKGEDVGATPLTADAVNIEDDHAGNASNEEQQVKKSTKKPISDEDEDLWDPVPLLLPNWRKDEKENLKRRSGGASEEQTGNRRKSRRIGNKQSVAAAAAAAAAASETIVIDD